MNIYLHKEHFNDQHIFKYLLTQGAIIINTFFHLGKLNPPLLGSSNVAANESVSRK